MTNEEQLPTHVATLIDKLEALDLTEQENEALGVLLGAAETNDSDDVAGFGWEEGVAAITVRGFNIGMPPSFNIGMPPSILAEVDRR